MLASSVSTKLRQSLWLSKMRPLKIILLFLIIGLAGCSHPGQQPVAPTPNSLFPSLRIKNAATNLYLTENNGIAALTYFPVSNSSLWNVEDYRGSIRLINLASGNYLTIQNLKDQVEVLPIQQPWLSPRWSFEGNPDSGSIVIRSVWRSWQVLLARDGQVRYDRVPTTDNMARWMLESASRTPIPAITPMPTINIPLPANPAGSRGAQVPWVEYEAEAGQWKVPISSVTHAEILPPERTIGTIASESSGRSAVKLTSSGDYVQFKTSAASNSVVIRYVIPDSADGAGLSSTISLYVDGVFRQKIPLTSKYAWSYGGEQQTLNTPAAGGAHHFYDEARALVGEIPAGATVKIQKDQDDSAEYVVVDLLDLEEVAPPKSMPAGFISIEECGAIPNSGADAGGAIQQCVDKARNAGTGLWIPPGTFESSQHALDVSDVTIQGAGMWYSNLHGSQARFNCVANNCVFKDFAILGETISRQNNATDDGFSGSGGTGSLLENIWVEHTKAGFWVSGETDGLLIKDSRFRDLYADGVNFDNGTSNSVIENSHFRNTGDDAMASWSPTSDTVNTGNIFRFNTVQLPWRASCIGIYGGKDTRVENNLCADVVTYAGILIAAEFNSNPFQGLTTISHNSLIRAGGSIPENPPGALKIWAREGAVSGVQVRDLLIDSPSFSGIELQGGYAITAASFDRVQISQAGTNGVYIAPDAQGQAAFSHISITKSTGQNVLNNAASLNFTLSLGEGNTGWPAP